MPTPTTPAPLKSDRRHLIAVYESLLAWCRARDYAGHDPFDGLNSRIFRAVPFLRDSRAMRLAWTQGFKRAPINLRSLAAVPRERNAKGMALFALAALARYRAEPTAEHEKRARHMLDALIALRLDGYAGAAWGYNFDWQGRAFYAPRKTPTVVPTAFAMRALTEGYAAFREEKHLRAARSACDFLLGELHLTAETADEVCFSYTPRDRTRVFNASLLAGEGLAAVGAHSGEKELVQWGLRAARYVVRRQREDGSWAYGEDDYQSWSDNFHTAFVLTSLARIMRDAGKTGELNFVDERSLRESLRRGDRFWRTRFFLADGWPKYYHDKLYPADAHSAGAGIIALLELNDLEYDAEARELAETIALWTLTNLGDARGFFYYQRRRLLTVRTPYMRWTQSWMLYALARLIESSRQ